jgi:hypothetical protein
MGRSKLILTEEEKEERRLKKKEVTKIYREKNREKLLEYGRAYTNRIYKENRTKIFNILGKKCEICGETNGTVLSIDHIHNDGVIVRKKHGGNFGELTWLNNLDWPEDYIRENYQILCYNHNCGKNRTCFDKTNITNSQRHYIKLWKKANIFFGNCAMCGCDNLKFLTIDHVNGGGAKLRRSGEKSGVNLLKQFNSSGWPEDLKLKYQILCFNCGLGKKNNRATYAI